MWTTTQDAIFQFLCLQKYPNTNATFSGTLNLSSHSRIISLSLKALRTTPPHSTPQPRPSVTGAAPSCTTLDLQPPPHNPHCGWPMLSSITPLSSQPPHSCQPHNQPSLLLSIPP